MLWVTTNRIRVAGPHRISRAARISLSISATEIPAAVSTLEIARVRIDRRARPKPTLLAEAAERPPGVLTTGDNLPDLLRSLSAAHHRDRNMCVSPLPLLISEQSRRLPSSAS